MLLLYFMIQVVRDNNYLFSDRYAIPKIKMSCNLCYLKARLRLLCNKLSIAQQPEPRFKTP